MCFEHANIHSKIGTLEFVQTQALSACKKARTFILTNGLGICLVKPSKTIGKLNYLLVLPSPKHYCYSHDMGLICAQAKKTVKNKGGNTLASREQAHKKVVIKHEEIICIRGKV